MIVSLFNVVVLQYFIFVSMFHCFGRLSFRWNILHYQVGGGGIIYLFVHIKEHIEKGTLKHRMYRDKRAIYVCFLFSGLTLFSLCTAL